jgi:hypothetical protein
MGDEERRMHYVDYAVEEFTPEEKREIETIEFVRVSKPEEPNVKAKQYFTYDPYWVKKVMPEGGPERSVGPLIDP